MLTRTQGIVLKTFPFAEADLIVTYLTRDHGVRKAFAKSPRKIKSRFGGSLEPLTLAKISLMGREDAQLPRLTQSDILRPFQSLRESYSAIVRLMAMAELTIGLMHEGEPAGEAFSLLSDTLDFMERNNAKIGTAALYYKIRLLKLAGYAPGLKGCGRCGAEVMDFYVSHGTVLCAPCARGSRAGDAVALTAGASKVFATLLHWDMARLNRLKVSDAMIAELDGLIVEHVQHVTSKALLTNGFSAAASG